MLLCGVRTVLNIFYFSKSSYFWGGCLCSILIGLVTVLCGIKRVLHFFGFESRRGVIEETRRCYLQQSLLWCVKLEKYSVAHFWKFLRHYC